MSTELIDLFTAKAKAVQAYVTPIKTMREAFEYAVKITKDAGGQGLAAPLPDSAGLDQLQGLCAEAGIECLPDNLRANIGKFYVGLTVAEAGIAKTGTLLQASTDENLRLASMLSEEHVAVIRASTIVPDSASLGKTLTSLTSQPGSYTAFITGASRTADIERVLTLGVHGPLALHILILEEEAA